MKTILLAVLLAVSGFALAGELYAIKSFPNSSNWIVLAPALSSTSISSVALNAGGNEVLKIDANGTTTWHGHVIESDDEFKVAMISVSEFLNGRKHCK